jgi:hypothetical protein
MTLKQTKNQVQQLLQSHAMIRRVIYNTPQEWMFAEQQPEYPLACFWIGAGSLEQGFKNFNVTMWFLDIAGKEGIHELDVVSDQVEIANDIVALLRQSHLRSWQIDDNIQLEIISDALEDYIAGVRLEVNIKTINRYDACSVPINP